MTSSPIWNSDVKPGDKLVCVEGRLHYKNYTIRVVSRLTPTQVVCDNDMRINRKTGERIGPGRYQVHWQPLTPEIEAQMRQEERARNAGYWANHESNKQIAKLTLEQIEQIRSMVEFYAKQNEKPKTTP